MTSEEFEKYLESIGGLENGFFPDRPPIVTNLCSCDEGWLQLIADCIADLIAVGWDKQITQIKEKFGGLRFYINSGSEEIHNIISKYETLSYKTCETCGEAGELRRDLGWWRTLCDKHHNEKLEEIQKRNELVQKKKEDSSS